MTGTCVDDEIAIYDTSGLLLSRFKATSDVEKINFKGLLIVKVQSEEQIIALKVVN